MIGANPIDMAILNGLPEVFNILTRSDRRIYFRINSIGCIGIEEKVPNGDLTTEVYIWKYDRHFESRVNSFSRGQVQ